VRKTISLTKEPRPTSVALTCCLNAKVDANNPLPAKAAETPDLIPSVTVTLPAPPKLPPVVIPNLSAAVSTPAPLNDAWIVQFTPPAAVRICAVSDPAPPNDAPINIPNDTRPVNTPLPAKSAWRFFVLMMEEVSEPAPTNDALTTIF